MVTGRGDHASSTWCWANFNYLPYKIRSSTVLCDTIIYPYSTDAGNWLSLSLTLNNAVRSWVQAARHVNGLSNLVRDYWLMTFGILNSTTYGQPLSSEIAVRQARKSRFLLHRSSRIASARRRWTNRHLPIGISTLHVCWSYQPHPHWPDRSPFVFSIHGRCTEENPEFAYAGN